MADFNIVHPDRGSQPLPHDSVTTGRNLDLGDYPESGYLRCKKCGFILNKYQKPKGWETGHKQASTQLNGEVTAGGTTLTVDDNSSFPTNLTGTITAFASMGNLGTKVTDAAHGLAGKGDMIIISSSTNYNGTFHISDVLTDTFVIPKKFVADDGESTWTVPEYLYIFDVGVYSSDEDVSSTYTAATGGPRMDKVLYTGKDSTTGFTGCKSLSRASGVNAHDDDMHVRGERIASGGCPSCSTFIYD